MRPGFIENAPLLKFSSMARAYAPVVCTEDVVKIAGQQGRYAVHGLCPLILINVATFTVL